MAQGGERIPSGIQFLRFCSVGALGFLVDSGMTVVGASVWGLGPTGARLLAFAIAATVTWAFHSRFTFETRIKVASWLPYVGLTAFGALINVGVFALWVRTAGADSAQLVLGVALGSIAALSFNWTVSRHLVFRAKNGGRQGPR